MSRFNRGNTPVLSNSTVEPSQSQPSENKKFGFSFLNKKKDTTIIPPIKINPPESINSLAKTNVSQTSIKYAPTRNQLQGQNTRNNQEDQEVVDKIKEIVTDYLSTEPNKQAIRQKPAEEPRKKFGFNTQNKNQNLVVPQQFEQPIKAKNEKDQEVLDQVQEIVNDYLYTKPIKEKKFGFSFLNPNKVEKPRIATPLPPPRSAKKIEVPTPRKAILDRIIDDLSEFLVKQDGEPAPLDQAKLDEIQRLLDKITGHIKSEKIIPIPVSTPLQNYSNVIQEDDQTQNFLSDLLDMDDYTDNLNQTLLKRKAYVDAKLVPKNVSNIFLHADKYPPPAYSDPFNRNKYPLLSRNKSEAFAKSNLVADRYDIKLMVPVMQDFSKLRQMAPNIFNFMMFFLQEKADHQRKHNDGYKYGTSIKLFPLQFYLALTNNLISNTYKIEYMEASKFTFEHTGLDNTIFNVYDWVVVPIMELPSEYSLVIANLSSRTIYCFQLSSLGCKDFLIIKVRISDPSYSNPDKNPYLKNVQSFLHREFEIKCSRARIKLGNYTMVFGKINKDPNFNHKIRYEDSGLYAVYIIIHLLKFGNVEGIQIEEQQMLLLCKTLHDLIVRIGYNVDESIFYILDENKWPF